MEWGIADVAVILVTLAWLGMMGYTAFLGLKIKNTVMGGVPSRVRPMISKGKAIADTGKREFEQNKDRWQALAAEAKGLANAVKPSTLNTAPRVQVNYRTLLTAFSVLGTVRRGWAQMRTARNPGSNPPGPAAAPEKAPRRPLGTLELLPHAVRLFREVRRALR